jgi:hypothetical protein
MMTGGKNMGACGCEGGILYIPKGEVYESVTAIAGEKA